ncbi:MAG TPA: protein kinase [Ktedonobacteraceae bacterium]|nr:protein kinase [Ktedonobacteraceae bacterium]
MMIDYTGQQIGSYQLVQRLGRGGFASVYLGQHVRITTQQAAIKLLHLFDVDAKKFQQEAETTAALVHPHIIRLFDFDFHDQMPFLVIEYAPGGSLRTCHPKGTQVPLPTVVQYVQQITEAFVYAYSTYTTSCAHTESAISWNFEESGARQD